MGLPKALQWAVLALLAWLVVVPLGLLVSHAVTLPPERTSDISGSSLAVPLRNSLLLALASVVTAGLVGIPLAFLVARGEFPGRRFWEPLLALPVALPPLVGALAYLYLWGESGWLSRAVGSLFLGGEPAWSFQGLPAILVVHTGTLYVYFYLFVRAALARTDPALEEAARALGARPWRRLRTVLWPQIQPAVRGAATLTLLMALGSFSAPYLFGGQFRVLPTQILASKQNGDLDRAEVETAVLVAVALLLLLGGAAWRSQAAHGGHRGRAPQGTVTPAALRGKLVRAVLTSVLGAVLLAPLLTLVLLSFVPPGSWTREAVPPRWSLEAWSSVFLQEPQQLVPLIHSAWMALLATTVALPLGWVLARTAHTQKLAGRFAELLLALPWAIPATAFALALAVTWGRHQPALGRFVLVGTAWLLPLAYLVRSLPTLGRGVLAGLARVEPTLEEASRGLGAGWLRTELMILRPLLGPALLSAALLAFVTALGDFVVAIVLYSPAAPPVSIEILAALRLGETAIAAVHGTLLVLAGAAVFLFISRLDGMRS